MLARALIATLVIAGSNPWVDAQERTSLRVSRGLDGLGGLLDNVIVVVEGTTIREIGPDDDAIQPTFDLSGLTVLPGLIDTHVHVGWHFDPDGRLHSDDSEPKEVEVLYAAKNAYAMLMSGFTTVQSLGSPIDKPLRDAIDSGGLPGPRILTSLRSVNERTGTPAEIRRFVREQEEQGADVIKIFGSASIRVGGTPTMSQEQLDAACGEAIALGLRAVVHAHGSESARRAIRAGCTTIEHGALLDNEVLSLMAQEGVFYDPNTHLIFQNYFDNKDRYIGIGNYNDEGFRQMAAAVPRALEVFRESLEIPGLQIVFGTDAVAGAHGRNIEELLYRVRTGGQDPHEAVVSVTSLAAKSLGLEASIGSVTVGRAADLIAVEGDPLEDITALTRVRFVMRAGRIVKNAVSVR